MIGRFVIPLLCAVLMAALGIFAWRKASDPTDRRTPAESKIAASIGFGAAAMFVAWAFSGFFR